MTEQPWTWKEFISAMRKVGWTYSASNGQGVFFYGKRQFSMWSYDDEYTEVWRRWAAMRHAPTLEEALNA